MTTAKKLLVAGAVGGAAVWYYLKLEEDRKLQSGQLSAENLGRRVDDAASGTQKYLQDKYSQGVDLAEKEKKALSNTLSDAQKASENQLNQLTKSAAEQKDSLVKNVDNAVVNAGDKSKGWIDSTVGWVTGKK